MSRTTPIDPSDRALLHHLQHAADAEDLPKHVAHELQQQGLAEAAGHSPGRVVLTEAGRRRLLQLSEADRDGEGVHH